MLRSEATAGVICLPRMPLTAPELQNTDTNGIHADSAFFVRIASPTVLSLSLPAIEDMNRKRRGHMTRESGKLSMDAFHHLSSPHRGEWDPLPKWCTRNSLEWSQANTTSPTVRLWTGCVAGSAFPYWDLPLCAFAGPDHPQNHPLNHSYTKQLSIVPSAMVKWPPNEHWLPSYNYILLTHVLNFCWPLHVLLLLSFLYINMRTYITSAHGHDKVA